MNEFKRLLVQKHEDRILADVTSPDEIVLHLQSKGVITDLERGIISSSKNKTATILKVLLQKKDGPWFEEFVHALEPEFNWIASSLRADLTSEEDEKLVLYLRYVPPPPNHSIARQDLVQKLQKDIRDLKRDSFLVVQGMSGFGKTCLVVDALRNVNLLEDALGGNVYWLSVGHLRDDEPDDLQYSELQKRLCDMINLSVNDQQDLLIQLKNHFSKKPNSSALLVLDKVRSHKVVEALNIGCKVVVTTLDCDVVKSPKKKLFHVGNGFSESESVNLLERFVFDGPGQLPPKMKDIAIKIHRAWKGHPMIIGLIGGELSEEKEESQRHPSRWKDYVRSTFSEESTRRQSVIAKQIGSIIELTTDRLQPSQKKLFEMFAVLVEDTNITTDVLQILWEVDKQNAEKNINNFYRRSLVCKKYNSILGKSVYGIHDMLIEHLRKDISSTDLQTMHEELVRKYYTACNGNFANLPKDNYIFSYLCHHIESAKLWDELRDQFYTLQYIESKLKATGPGDLLLDLHKYHVGLEGNNDAYRVRVEDIKRFVKESGWDINRNEVDAIQCALLEPKKSFLFKQGSDLAASARKIYFAPLHVLEKPKDLEMEVNQVNTLSIVSNAAMKSASGRVLVCPNDECLIVELDLNYRERRRSFTEKSRVVCLKMSPSGDKFLSALDNGDLNVWNLSSENTESANTPPPSMRQKDYLPHFTETRMIPLLSFHHSRQITCASFSTDGKSIVSASQNGSLYVWNVDENKEELCFDLHPNPYAIACSFICDDKMVVCGSSNLAVFFIDRSSERSVGIKQLDKNGGNLVSLLCMIDKIRHLLVVQEKMVTLLRWTNETLKHKILGPRDLELVGTQYRRLYEESSTIFSAVYHPQHRLLLGTSNGCLLFFDVLNESCLPIRFDSGEVKAVDMIDRRIVFATSGKVKMCWPEPGRKHEKQPLSTHLGWTPREVSVYSTATSNGDIKIYHDGKLCAETFRQMTCVVRVSTHGHHVLIGTRDGGIFLFDSVSRHMKDLKSRLESEIKYLSIGMCAKGPVYLAAARDGESYTLQAIMYDSKHWKSHGQIRAPVVKTFVCFQQQYLIAVLGDYSIMMWDFKSESLYQVQEGRTTAKVTDASLSKNENLLVLSDEENCFHIFSLGWPEAENGHISTERSNALRPPRLILPLNNNNNHICPPGDGIDEVDGIHMSVVPGFKLKIETQITGNLQKPSWCVSVCPRGSLIAVGYDECEVMVWGVEKKTPLTSFQVLPNRRTKVRQLQFSPYDVRYGDKQYGLILFSITDCLSLWDLSSFVTDNFKSKSSNPECLGCVSAGGNAICELSISPSCTKFAASDVTGTYFLWEAWDRANPKGRTLDSVVSNGNLSECNSIES